MKNQSCTIQNRVIILVQSSTHKNQLSFSTYTYIQTHSTYSYILQPKGDHIPKVDMQKNLYDQSAKAKNPEMQERVWENTYINRKQTS